MSYVDLSGLDRTSYLNTAGGRSPTKDGPTNGNWGGRGWSGRLGPGQVGPPAPPTDSGDELYEQHDNCYDCCKGDKACEKSCDKKLTKDLKALPLNTSKWPKPPPAGTETDTNIYRGGAIFYF